MTSVRQGLVRRLASDLGPDGNWVHLADEGRSTTARPDGSEVVGEWPTYVAPCRVSWSVRTRWMYVLRLRRLRPPYFAEWPEAWTAWRVPFASAA